MYSRPQIELVGNASDLIQGSIGHGTDPGVSNQTKVPMPVEFETE
jgi:hypothetical protein